MDVISIIVPVYKVEKYIAQCVESIINQSYKNLEIILVDDGSPDKCGTICDEYAKKDSRITVIHKNNGGLSSARNAGLAVASGDYIGFVDSDDYIEPQMYEKMLSFMNEEKCDVVECGVNIIRDGRIIKFCSQQNETITGSGAVLRQLEFTQKNEMFLPRIAVWSKLFKRELLKGKSFPEGHIHEDYLLVCQVFWEVSKIGLLKEGLYNHLSDNPGSIMNSSFSQRDLYKQHQYKERARYLESQSAPQEIIRLGWARYYYILIEMFWQCYEHKLEEVKTVQKEISMTCLSALKSPLPHSKKIEYIMIAKCPNFYMKVRRFGKNLHKGKKY